MLDTIKMAMKNSATYYLIKGSSKTPKYTTLDAFYYTAANIIETVQEIWITEVFVDTYTEWLALVRVSAKCLGHKVHVMQKNKLECCAHMNLQSAVKSMFTTADNLMRGLNSSRRHHYANLCQRENIMIPTCIQLRTLHYEPLPDIDWMPLTRLYDSCKEYEDECVAIQDALLRWLIKSEKQTHHINMYNTRISVSRLKHLFMPIMPLNKMLITDDPAAINNCFNVQQHNIIVFVTTGDPSGPVCSLLSDLISGQHESGWDGLVIMAAASDYSRLFGKMKKFFTHTKVGTIAHHVPPAREEVEKKMFTRVMSKLTRTKSNKTPPPTIEMTNAKPTKPAKDADKKKPTIKIQWPEDRSSVFVVERHEINDAASVLPLPPPPEATFSTFNGSFQQSEPGCSRSSELLINLDDDPHEVVVDIETSFSESEGASTWYNTTSESSYDVSQKSLGRSPPGTPPQSAVYDPVSDYNVLDNKGGPESVDPDYAANSGGDDVYEEMTYEIPQPPPQF